MKFVEILKSLITSQRS